MRYLRRGNRKIYGKGIKVAIMNKHKKSVLVIVDLQVDFCPGGSLAVDAGDEIVDGVNNLISVRKGPFKKIVLTADWHPGSHKSFASTHNLVPFSIMKHNGTESTLWPDHCIEGLPGAKFHSGLNADKADLIIRKGRDPEIDSYSAFYENDRITPTGLQGYLENHGITQVFLCGLAFDWCVFFFNDTATTEIYTLSLHDALPI